MSLKIIFSLKAQSATITNSPNNKVLFRALFVFNTNKVVFIMLKGKKGLILGVANDASIATGCAEAMVNHGAEVILSYGHPKSLPYVQPISNRLQAGDPVFADVSDDDSLDALFETIKERFGHLDFLVHSVAFASAKDLHGPVVNCSREGFLQAMDISCYSLIACACRAQALMSAGGSIATMTFYGAEKYVANYNIMGPIKTALEHTARYLAYELGPKSIRINALSPGTLPTRAASGIAGFETLRQTWKERAPIKDALAASQVGEAAAFLASDNAKTITGEVIHIDGGYHLAG